MTTGISSVSDCNGESTALERKSRKGPKKWLTPMTQKEDCCVPDQWRNQAAPATQLAALVEPAIQPAAPAEPAIPRAVPAALATQPAVPASRRSNTAGSRTTALPRTGFSTPSG